MKQKKQIIVYFANWHLGKKPADHGGEVSSIPWNKVTYINHAFWAVTPADGTTESSFAWREAGHAPRKEFKIVSMRPENDMIHFAQYAELAPQYPDVNIMLSIGGWARCGYFSEMAHTPEGRASFIQSCVELLQKHSWIGGIDIDWEYPGCTTAGERAPDPNADDGDEGCPIWSTGREDNENFTRLLKELRHALDNTFGESIKKLTACAGASVATTLPCQDWASAAPYLDMINLMTYDLAGVWDGITGHASSLAGTESAVNYLKAQGIPENKMCIGTPFYGISFLMKEMESTQVVGVAAETHRATNKEITVTECNAFEEAAACRKGDIGWHCKYDSRESAAYLYNNDETSPYYRWFITYESAVSLQAKLDKINNSELAGIIIWECSQDTGNYDLMSQMAAQLFIN